MANYSTEGIIINIRNFLEADRIIKILSKDKGIFEAIAKGARKPTTRKSSSIEILNSGKMLFAKGKNLHLLLEVKLEDDYQGKINPLDINYYFYFAELLNKTLVEVDTGMYQKIKTLRDSLPQKIKLTLLKLQLLLLHNLGVIPNLRNCIECSDSLKEERYVISNQIGYFCKIHAGESQKITDREIKIQLFLLENGDGKNEQLDVEHEFNTLFDLHNTWIESTIERKINSFKLLS